MLGWWAILRLRSRYGNLDAEGFQELLQTTLGDLGKTVPGPLHGLLLELGLQLRPYLDERETYPADDMRWKHWIALAMRYFTALAQEAGARSRPHTVADVRDRLERDRELKQVLLFGDRELVYTVLREGLDTGAWRSQIANPTPEQGMVLDIIRYHVRSRDISERQVRNWSTELHGEWAETLRKRLQVRALAGLSQVARWVVEQLTGSSGRSDPALFREHIRRFEAAGLDWAHGLALGYHNELKRRYRMASQAAAWVMAGGASALLMVIALLAVRLLDASWVLRGVVAVLALLAFGAAGFHVVRFFVILFSFGGAVEAQLQTLSEIEALYLSEPEEAP